MICYLAKLPKHCTNFDESTWCSFLILSFSMTLSCLQPRSTLPFMTHFSVS